jgi:uncharacterized membrane protein
MLASRFNTLTVALVFALIAVVVAWQLTAGISAMRLVACAVFTCPLWAPLRGLLRRDRKTHAWATLCVIPYIVLGVTEAIASPEERLWAGLCLAVAFVLFATLIIYLRVSNPDRSAPLA